MDVIFFKIASCPLLMLVVLSTTISITEQAPIHDAGSPSRIKSLPFFQRQDDQLFHFDLAKAYGRLSQTGFAEMDKNMKIIIGNTVNEIMHLKELKWHNIIKEMTKNKLLKKNVTSEIYRRNRKTFVSKTMEIGNMRDPTLINSVASWFVNFVGDSQVLDDTRIDIGAVTEMLDAVKVGFHNAKTFVWNNNTASKRYVDSGILRIPDITYPHFVLYRIKLTASINLKRTLLFVKKHMHVGAEHHRIVYDLIPDEVLKLSKKSQGKALDEVEEVFSHLFSP